PVELVEALLGETEQLGHVSIEMLGDGGPAADRERDAVVLGTHHVPGAGDEGDEVRRQRLAGLELPDAWLHLRSRRVAEDAPLPWSADVERVGRLEVRLVEAGE